MDKDGRTREGEERTVKEKKTRTAVSEFQAMRRT